MPRLQEGWLRWPLLAAGAVGLVAIGYVLRGEDSPPRRTQASDVTAVVKRFAEASGARACDLLTDDALDGVYGGKRKCIERSNRFQPGAVRITKTVVAERTASVRATSLDGRTLFSVRLLKVSAGCDAGLPGNPWLISSVRSQPNV